MSNSIEIEKKALVNEADFKKFLKHFNLSEKNSFFQTNYYLDTKNLDLIKEGIFIRVRVLKNEIVMTFKAPLNEGLLEKSQNLTIEEFDDIKNNHIFPDGYVKDFLPLIDVDIKQLQIITSLKTQRYDVQYHEGLLSLDKNTYSGKTDYEVELEYSSEDGAIKLLSRLFKELKVPFVENKKSKTLRALLCVK